MLDDTWNYSDVEAFRCPGPRVRYLVITRNSQIGVLLGGQSYELDGLSTNDALLLITKRLNIVNYMDNYPFKDSHLQIIKSLDRHTQAISIAAAQLARRGEQFAPELANRIAKRLITDHPFKDLSLAQGIDRQFDLEVSLSLSYEDLRDELKAFFRSVGIFVSTGTFDVTAASNIVIIDSNELETHLSIEDTQDVLDELVDAALVIRHENKRYGLHRVLKSYALALLKRQGGNEAGLTIGRFLKHYLRISIEIFRTAPEYWASAERDFPQIHEAANQIASTVADTDQVSEIVSVLETLSWESVKNLDEATLMMAVLFAKSLWPYVRIRNIGIEGLCWLLSGLTAAKTLDNREDVAEIAMAVGDWYESRRKLKLAFDYYKHSIDTWVSLGKRSHATTGLVRLAIISSETSLFSEALIFLDRALELIDETNKEFRQAEIWGVQGAI